MILPNFLIGGAPKTGTTALHNYLRQHPAICMSEPKETFFFTDEYDRGVKWFAQHFEHCCEKKAVGEASTTTLYGSDAPKRVRETLGAPKLIFVLRNPVERAYSEYLFFVHKGRIPASISFEDVVLRNKSEYSDRILQMGCYDKYLSRFEEKFGRDGMKIILHEEFRSTPAQILEELFRFLGVEDTFRPDELGEHNTTRSPAFPLVYYWIRRLWHGIRDIVESQFPNTTETARESVRRLLFSKEKPPMSEEIRAYLQDFYEESTVRLDGYLDRDLGIWRE